MEWRNFKIRYYGRSQEQKQMIIFKEDRKYKKGMDK